MIWALEAAERYERPSCSECSDRLKKQRGCKKPGMDIEGQMLFRSTSPLLLKNEKPDELRECPVGFVLRECPQVYDAITAHAYSENGCFNPLESPPWVQEMVRVVGSERARHRDNERSRVQGQRDAAIGQRVLSNG